MAAKATKKPVPKSKLKASQKKKVNKWLIVGGIAAVAIIGALVVRFSSASSWRPIYTDNWENTIRSSSPGTGYDSIQLRSGRNYRFCVTGHGNGGNTNTVLSFSTYNTRSSVEPIRQLVADSPKGYGKSNEFHCSAVFRTSKSYWVKGWINWKSGKPMTIKSASIEELR